MGAVEASLVPSFALAQVGDIDLEAPALHNGAHLTRFWAGSLCHYSGNTKAEQQSISSGPRGAAAGFMHP
jgi:hypothetical protein